MEALVAAVGLDPPEVVGLAPHPASTRATERAATIDARLATPGVFMLTPIKTLPAAKAGERTYPELAAIARTASAGAF